MDATGDLEDRLIKDESQHRMVAVGETHPQFDRARVAKLSYQTLAENDQFRLVEIELQTGRKHQIRVQFSARGGAIVGDRKYGSRTPFKHGIALMSGMIRLNHPTRKEPITVVGQTPEGWPFDRVIRHHLKNLLS